MNSVRKLLYVRRTVDATDGRKEFAFDVRVRRDSSYKRSRTHISTSAHLFFESYTLLVTRRAHDISKRYIRDSYISLEGRRGYNACILTSCTIKFKYRYSQYNNRVPRDHTKSVSIVYNTVGSLS